MTEPAWEIKQELENEGLSSIVCGFYPANATLVCDFSDISSAVTLFCVGTDTSATERPRDWLESLHDGIQLHPGRVFPRLVAISLGVSNCGVKKGLG